MQSQSFLCKSENASILLDDMNFQIIKRNFFYKIILTKARPAVTLELGDGCFQPDGLSQIKLQADCVQSVEYLVRARLFAPILYDGILYHTIVFPFLCP